MIDNTSTHKTWLWKIRISVAAENYNNVWSNFMQVDFKVTLGMKPSIDVSLLWTEVWLWMNYYKIGIFYN